MEKRSRSELFEDVIIQLDSAAGEAREDGIEELAVYIEETLIPFIKEERLEALAEEVRHVPGNSGVRGCGADNLALGALPTPL
jgi:hypothetical protein